MSVRLLTNRIVKSGRFFLQCLKRDIYTNILDQGKPRAIPATLQKVVGQNAQIALRNNTGIFRFGQHARKLFIDNILNRVTTTYSADLRTQATKKLFYGDSAPFFALIGVSLASGAGVLTKEDELEGVCWEIREAAARIQNNWNKENISEQLDENFTIDKLDVGPPIAKGCAAVVYAASFKNDSGEEESLTNLMKVNDGINHKENFSLIQQNTNHPEMLSPIQNISRFVHNFGGSVDNLHAYNSRNTIDILFEKNEEKTLTPTKESNFNAIEVNTLSEDMIHDIQKPTEATNVDMSRYPLAMKMMFNYDIQSNAMAILRAMYKETVPARQRMNNEISTEWEKHIDNQTLKLAPHPNIVQMFGYFCGEVKNFRDGHILYPIAQPPRINPNGYGRNMSLYLVMKRYDCSLRRLLDTNELNMRTRILLFAQLLEAVTHINRHGIAHRDIKSDNILIEMNDDQSPPLLALSDFGCCLADKKNGLQVPYASLDIDKGGNAALMAPEIINKVPGAFAILNYGKSDLWACGAIAYEIFGMSNPFYSNGNQNDTKSLKNFNYLHSDLPKLPDNCPEIVQKLITNILNPNPSNRLSPDVAANVIQIFLWAPSSWLKFGGMPSSPEVLQWLLSLTTKVMCEGQITTSNDLNYKVGRRTYIEYVLICSFLARARLRRIRGALSWIQSVS